MTVSQRSWRVLPVLFLTLLTAAQTAVAVPQPNALPLDQWQRHVIDGERPWRALFITAADLNSDGHSDIVTGGWWYQNPGTASGDWPRHTIGSPLNNMATVHDFNNDGAPDILGTNHTTTYKNFEAKPVPFYWAQNDGSGNFTVRSNISSASGNFLQGVTVAQFASGDPWQVLLSWQYDAAGIQTLTIPNQPTSNNWAWQSLYPLGQGEAVTAGNIDRSGGLDLLLGTRWLRNDGSGWSNHILHDSNKEVDRSLLADMNGNGRLDAVVGYQGESILAKLAWYEQGHSATALWTEHTIDTIIGPMSLDVADMDGDGDLDVVVGEHNVDHPEQARLLIYENLDGQGTSWQQHTLFTGDEHHDGTQVVDIDQDGDLDIISIGWSHSRVLLYENTAVTLNNRVYLPTITINN